MGGQAALKPAAAVMNELDVVEQALHNVEVVSLTPEQKKASKHVVDDVERIVLQLHSDKAMTKAEKMVKAKAAIEELQGLQSQWELAAVETSLKQVTELPHLSPEQRAAAKKVVADVDATIEEVEAGKLTGADRNKKVSFAIKELQNLQRDWLNTTTASRVEALEQEIAAKKAMLKKSEVELKMARLEKELATKKLLLKKLIADKDQAKELEKQRKEDGAQAAMVSKLLATAKALAASRKNAAAPQKKAVGTAAVPGLSALVAQLQAQEQKVSTAIEHMDAEEKVREATLSASARAGEEAPVKNATTDAMRKGEQMLKHLMKEEHRKYLKARALKETERQELVDGIQSIQKGDAIALTHLMAKMEKESKTLQAKTKGFLY